MNLAKNILSKNLFLIEKIITVCFLFYTTRAGLEGYLVLQDIFANSLIRKALYLLTLILIGLHWQKFIKIVTKDIGVLLLVILAVISVMWSVNPEATWNSAKPLVISTLWGVYLAIRYSLKDQLNLLAWTFGIAGIFSLILVLFFPEQFGIHQVGPHVGLWKGAFNHKNDLGFQMLLSANVFAIVALVKSKYSGLLWGGFAMSLILILFSGSKTALLIMTIISLMIISYKFIVQDKKIKINVFPLIMTVILSIIFTFYQLNREESLNISIEQSNQPTPKTEEVKVNDQQSNQPMIKTEVNQKQILTITGRTPMWVEIWEKFQERPWLGYGYRAFYRSNEATDILNKFSWAGSPHNGYLDILLDFGLIGLLMFGFSLIPFCFRAGKKIYYAQNTYDFWPSQFIVSLILVNMVSSYSVMPIFLPWIIYVATAFTLAVEEEKPSDV